MADQYENIIVMGKSGAGKQPRIDVLTRTFGLRQLSTGDIFRKYLGLFNELGDERDLSRFHDAEADGFIPDDEIKKALNIAGRDDADGIVLGLKARYFVDQGLFVPDRITNALFESAFKSMGCRGVVLDGYPRTVDQAKFLVSLVERANVKLDAIMLVENEDDAIIERTMGRRICKSCGEVFHLEFRPPPEERMFECKSECDIVQRSDDTVDSLKARLNEFATKTQPALDFLLEKGIPIYRVPGNLPDYSPDAVQASVFEVMGIR
ncbi:MAG: nucleoside monophosphate kinase [Pontiella sp.]|nr:nucleoside monophosphate kinase [Pontiella sp.]